MTNDDLKRFYDKSANADRANDFARYDKNGRLQSEQPIENHDVATKAYVDAAVVSGGDATSVHTFTELTAGTSLITTDDGIEVSYDNGGKVLLPFEGSQDIVIDVDESHKKIKIYLDATTRSVIDRSLRTPIARPAKMQYVKIDTNGDQHLSDVVQDVILGTTYKTSSGDIVPNMTKDDITNTYSAFVNGTLTSLMWKYAGMVVHMKPLTVCENDGQLILTVLYNSYIISYTWAPGMTSVAVVASKW